VDFLFLHRTLQLGAYHRPALAGRYVIQCW
jgi:hypothetical protein